MEESKFILLSIIWFLSAIGYGGGIIYGLRFLRMNEVVDTRVPQFTSDMLFGKLGYNYKLFYFIHSKKYGKQKTLLLLILHFISIIMVFVIPVLMYEI